MQELPQSGSTRLGAQMAFTDDYPQKPSKLLDREIPGGNENVPQLGTLVVPVIKQEP